MRGSRRKFLSIFLTASVPLGVITHTVAAQVRSTKPPPKQGQKDEDTDDETKFDSKAMLEANQKDIKKNVERLFQLASELKTEVEKTDSVLVLSLALLKKTEEIEKLAKDIRSRAKG